MLRARLSIQEEAWANQQLTSDELSVLDAKRRRILWELDYLQSIAALSAIAGPSKPELQPTTADTPEPKAQSASSTPASMSP